MCNVCYKQFKGWCKSFTKIEIALTILQTVLLAVFIGFLTFLILHLLACVQTENFVHEDTFPDVEPSTTSESSQETTPTNKIPEESNEEHIEILSTLDPDVECTWKPSEKTMAVKHYYENDELTTQTILINKTASNSSAFMSTSKSDTLNLIPNYVSNTSEPSVSENSVDGTISGYLLALVKLRLPQDITFGCVLTIISEYWTVTSASCIESIEEVDAVDSFVMAEAYSGDNLGRTHTLSDILIHPEYQGVNKKYNMVLLKSEDSLIKMGQSVVKLPILLDVFVLTIGEQLSLLTYKDFRFQALEVLVHSVSSAQCMETWAPRHLIPVGSVVARSCGSAPLCVAVLGEKKGCEQYQCAGAPLVRGGVLVGVYGATCGEPCTSTYSANVAAAVDWIRSILAGDK